MITRQFYWHHPSLALKLLRDAEGGRKRTRNTPHCQGVQPQHGRNRLSRHVCDLNSRKRGRPSLEDDPTSHQAAPPPPPLQRIVAPTVDVRLDRCNHFPIHAEKRGCCRLCKNGYMQMACLKCKVLLCFTKDKNCFLEYHTTK